MQLDAFLYLIIVVCVGFAAIKLKLLPSAVTDTLPLLLTNICYPAMILSLFDRLSIADLKSVGLKIIVITIIVTLLLYFIGKIVLHKLERPQRLMFNFMLGIGNVTYVGIPLISIFFGAEGVYYALIHGVVQDMLIWILYYPTYLGKEAKDKVRLFHNPCMIALIIGLLLTITHLELPSFLTYALNNLSSATSPVALLFLGAIIAKFGLLGWMKSTPAMVASAIKVLAVPLILFCVLGLFTDSYTAMLMSILFACPAPIISIVWAEQYDGDVALSINCCICSTLLYLISMSILLSIVSAFGLILL